MITIDLHHFVSSMRPCYSYHDPQEEGPRAERSLDRLVSALFGGELEGAEPAEAYPLHRLVQQLRSSLVEGDDVTLPTLVQQRRNDDLSWSLYILGVKLAGDARMQRLFNHLADDLVPSYLLRGSPPWIRLEHAAHHADPTSWSHLIRVLRDEFTFHIGPAGTSEPVNA